MRWREICVLCGLMAGFGLLPYESFLLYYGSDFISFRHITMFGMFVLFLDQVEVFALSVFVSYRLLVNRSLKAEQKAVWFAAVVLASAFASFFLLHIRGETGFPPSLSHLLYL